jgi:hypothetical protein
MSRSTPLTSAFGLSYNCVYVQLMQGLAKIVEVVC